MLSPYMEYNMYPSVFHAWIHQNYYNISILSAVFKTIYHLYYVLNPSSKEVPLIKVFSQLICELYKFKDFLMSS